jgi:hypothetical protein
MQLNLKKKDQVFYLRKLPEQEINEILRLTLRTVTDEYFVGIEEKEQHAFLFHYSDIGKIVFLTYGEALEHK